MQEPEIILKTMMRGLVDNSVDKIYKSHRELYKLGDSVIPIIEDQLFSYSWDEIKYGAELDILSGLLSLVNDISETKAKELGDKIIENDCDNIVASRIKSIINFSLNKFNSYKIGELTIFQSKELSVTANIKQKMESWLSYVSEDDLNRIDRIYIIPETDEEHMGTYTPILCSIMIEWSNTFSKYNLFSYLLSIQVESTLYHEIGHHVHGHTFGNVPDQEREADKYAGKILSKSHPILSVIVKSIKWMFSTNKRKSENPR